MGLFNKKHVSDEAIFSSLILTFAHSIDAVEKGNGIVLNEAWDLFINTAGLLIDRGLISENDLETLIDKGNFPNNHKLTLDYGGHLLEELSTELEQILRRILVRLNELHRMGS